MLKSIIFLTFVNSTIFSDLLLDSYVFIRIVQGCC